MTIQHRILITGGAGFIGSNLVRYILQNRPDLDIVNLDLLTYAGSLHNLEGILDHPKHQFVEGDINNATLVNDLLNNCDSIINVAAESHVDRSIDNATPFIHTNINGTQTLLDAARKQSSFYRFIQVSTDEVYGELPLDDTAKRFTEQSPLEPSSPYAASKAAADLLVRSYSHTFGLPVSITRCTNNFGPYQYPEKVIPLFTLNLLQDKQIPLYGDGLNVRDWIHVNDHVEALLHVFDHGKNNTVYNIGAENEISNIQLVHALLEILDKDESSISYVEDRLGHDRRYGIDPGKIRQELNWYATQSQWPAALIETVNWYRDHTEWVEAILRDNT